MGQARARGTKDERVAQAVEAAKVAPPKYKKLNQTQIRAHAMGTAIRVMGEMFGLK